MGQVLAVISGKGGTGKTSVCAGVAGCLCMEGARVLCIDADLGLRNLDISLGMASEAGLSFLDVMRGDYAIEQAPRAAGLPGLQLLTAPVSVKADEIDRGAFEALIHDAKERYDWVLIDAPAGVGAGFELAIRFADELVVVCLADPAFQRGAARAAGSTETARFTPPSAGKGRSPSRRVRTGSSPCSVSARWPRASRSAVRTIRWRTPFSRRTFPSVAATTSSGGPSPSPLIAATCCWGCTRWRNKIIL